MILIEKADKDDAYLLSEMAAATFLESHGSSAAPGDINSFIAEKYNPCTFTAELSNPKNNYHVIYYNGRAAGFSNIIYDSPGLSAKSKDTAKLERIYLLKEFYGLKLGQQLIEFNKDLAIQNNQSGIWLFVWKDNLRAISFYKKNGFTAIGSFDYRISATHTNPNHQMLLEL